METILTQYTMQAGSNAVWGGPAPKAQVVESQRNGKTIYIARSPWSEQAYASYDDADEAARRMAKA